jgi:hypothetical protein
MKTKNKICLDEIMDEDILTDDYSPDSDTRYEAILDPIFVNNGILYGQASIEKIVKRKPGNNPLSKLFVKYFPEKTEYYITTDSYGEEIYTEDSVKIKPGLEEVKERIKEIAQSKGVQIPEIIINNTFGLFEKEINGIYKLILTY